MKIYDQNDNRVALTGTNASGFTTAPIMITVNDQAPMLLAYSTISAVYTKGQAISSNVPSNRMTLPQEKKLIAEMKKTKTFLERQPKRKKIAKICRNLSKKIVQTVSGQSFCSSISADLGESPRAAFAFPSQRS